MKKRYKVIIIFGALIVILFIFLTFQGTKKLRGIDYFLLDDDMSVGLCHYDGDRFGGPVVVDDVKQVFWNDKYIVAQAKGKYSDVYYIIEQLETDTIVVYDSEKKIFRNKKHWFPWITEEYKQYAPFCKRLQELNIDTTQMQHYSWKYWVGIY